MSLQWVSMECPPLWLERTWGVCCCLDVSTCRGSFLKIIGFFKRIRDRLWVYIPFCCMRKGIVCGSWQESWFSIYLKMGTISSGLFLSHSKLTCSFLLAILTKALRTIYVNRDDTDSKMKAAHEIQRRALSGGVWPKVLLFPEGYWLQLILNLKASLT